MTQGTIIPPAVDQDSIEYGHVYANYVKSVADTPADPDADPDIIHVNGQVTFDSTFPGSAARGSIRLPAEPRSYGLIVTGDTFEIINSKLVDHEGREGVRLVASVDGMPISWQAVVTLQDSAGRTIYNQSYIVHYDLWSTEGGGLEINLPDLIPTPSRLEPPEGAAVRAAEKALEEIRALTGSNEQINLDLEGLRSEVVTLHGQTGQRLTAAEAARDAAQTARTGAETARTGAESARDTANTHRTAAQTARTGAEGARDAAAGSASAASTSATTAGTQATLAGERAGAAGVSRDAASGSAAAAAGSADAAAGSASAAQTSNSQALAYRNTASTHATTATTKAGEASASAAAAWSSEQAAKTSETNAKTSETNAGTSASQALSYRNTASTHASTATTKATEASASAGAAASSASTASTKAGDAAGSATDAEAARAAAVVARTGAQTARTGAEGARDAADGHATRAETAADSFGLTATATTGAAGSNAAVAVTGDGPAYALGLTVPRGDKGDTGDTGPKGDKGEQGPRGLQGPKGDQGDTGPKGDRGDDGEVSQEMLDAAVATLVDNAPEALDTLSELADALGGDPNFATTVSTQIGERAKTSDVNAALAGKADAGAEATATWAGVSGKPSTFTPTTGSTASTAKPGNWSPTWGEVSGKPATFPAASHSHTAAEVGARPSSWVPSWSEVTGKPTTFPSTIPLVSGLADALANAGSNDAGDLTGALTDQVQIQDTVLRVQINPEDPVSGYVDIPFGEHLEWMSSYITETGPRQAAAPATWHWAGTTLPSAASQVHAQARVGDFIVAPNLADDPGWHRITGV